MAKKRKRKKTSRSTSKIVTRKILVSCSFLIILMLMIFGVYYLIVDKTLMEFGISNTTNNITFNDLFDSDTIKISNLKRINDKDCKKLKPIDLNIKGISDNLEYEILLIPINVSVDNSYINYYLTDENDKMIKMDHLNNTNISDDYSGNVIYTGLINNKKEKIKLRVWIDDKYDGEINSNLFEVKIKLK